MEAPKIAVANNIDASFTYLGAPVLLLENGNTLSSLLPPLLLSSSPSFTSSFFAPPSIVIILYSGTKSNYVHENYQLIQIDGVWYLLCTGKKGVGGRGGGGEGGGGRGEGEGMNMKGEGSRGWGEYFSSFYLYVSFYRLLG